MTTPHDDELNSELLNVPDHRPDFWTALDADLAAVEREDVVPLTPASSARSRGRGLLLAAAVLAVLGGIGAWFAFGGDDDGPEPVTVAPEDVPEAVRFQFRWIDPDGDRDPAWSTMTMNAFGDKRVDYADGSTERRVGAFSSFDESPTTRANQDEITTLDAASSAFASARIIAADYDTAAEEPSEYLGRPSYSARIDSNRPDVAGLVTVDVVTWVPLRVEREDGWVFEVADYEAAGIDPSSIGQVSQSPPRECCETVDEAREAGHPAHAATWLPSGFSLSHIEVDESDGEVRQLYEAPWRWVGVWVSSEFTDYGEPDSPGAASVVDYPSTGPLHIAVLGNVHLDQLNRILEGLEFDDISPDRTVVEPVPADVVQSVTATAERVSEVGASGTFALVADEDGTIIVRGDDLELGWHAPSGATWRIEGETSVNEIDPIDGRRGVESLLMLDLAESVRYGGLGTAADRDGRGTYEATVDLADNESAGWFDRTATVTVDFQTGFVLDATITDDTGEVVEELHLTDIVWSDEPVDISGAVGVESEWTVTEGVPAAPVVGDRYLVPEGVEPTRTFTTVAAVASGSEAGNPPSDGAYVVDVSTGPWRHSKIIVFGRTGGEWQDPLAEEGWFTEPESVSLSVGVLAGMDGSLVATPPTRPRAWFETADEIVAVRGLIDPATARRMLNLVQAAGPGFSPELPYVSGAPDGAESAFSLDGGVVLARRVGDGAAAATAWVRAVDEIWWEPAGGALGVEPLILDTGDAHAVVLLDAFVDDDGEIAAIYGEIPSPEDGEPAETNVWLQRFGQLRSEAIELGWFTGPEHGVDAASRGADRVAISAGADLGEVFTFYDLKGNEIDEPNNPVPVGHRYSEPPFYQHVALAPDGRTLAFIEGPDWDREAQDTVGDWELVVVDLDSGDETARLALGDRGTMRVSFVDFDGTWAIVSHTEDTGDLRQDQPLPALAVSTADGTVTELVGRTGIVTLVDAR